DGADVGARVSTGGVDGGTPEAINISGANTIIGTNLNLAQNDRGVRTAGRMELNVTDGATIQGNIHTNIHGDKVDQIINVTNSTVKGDILGSATGVDKVTVTNSTIDNINTKGGDDIISTLSGAKISSAIKSGGGDDTVTIQGSGTSVVSGVDAEDGNDIIKVSDSAKIEGNLFGGKGDDIISLTGEGTSARLLDGAGGKDVIIKDDKASSTGIAGGDTVVTNKSGNLIINDIDSSKTIDLSNISKVDKNIKSIDLSEVDGAKLNITAQDVLDINKNNSSETLTIKGGSDDSVKDSDGGKWSTGATIDGNTTYTNNTNTVSIIIDNDIDTKGLTNG
ncbi:hypothetical protein, partial [Campylobacter sp. RM16191]